MQQGSCRYVTDNTVNLLQKFFFSSSRMNQGPKLRVFACACATSRGGLCQTQNQIQALSSTVSCKPTNRKMDFIKGIFGFSTTSSASSSSNVSKEEIKQKIRENPMAVNEAEWKEVLDGKTFHVAREKGTERPFSSKLNDEHRKGQFLCACCSQPLFESDTVSTSIPKLVWLTLLCFDSRNSIPERVGQVFSIRSSRRIVKMSSL